MQEIIKLFKASFTSLETVIEARKINWLIASVYIGFLSLILALPITTDIWTAAQQLAHDFRQVAQKIPDFHIKNGKLVADEGKGFIYQSERLVFTYDPDGKRTPANIESDATGYVWAISFSPEAMIVAVPQEVRTTFALQEHPLTFSYTGLDIENFDGTSLRASLNRFGTQTWALLIIFVFSFLPALINVIWQVLFLGTIGYFYNRLVKNEVRLHETMKIVLFASSAPIVLSTALSFIFPRIDAEFIIMLTTLLLYFRIVDKKRLLNNK
jgi:hypothetical protein